MAWRTSSSAIGASAFSPLRTPRERAWPRPTMLSPLSAPSSPTTAQTLDVPISRPTMMEEGSNMFFLVAQEFGHFGGDRRDSAGFEPTGRNVIRDSQIERGNGFAYFLSGINNFAPAAQLLFEIGQGEGDFAALAGSRYEHVGSRHINA